MDKKWWQKAVVYQIYPRSFYDTNGDGIGDIRGITKKLDYISNLGVDVLWICPVYRSPMDDNGYDISDYQDINKEFGTIKDMDELIEEVGKRNIKIIMDMVVNHTSDEHPWFIESRSRKDNDKRDYYYWRKPSPDGGPPNNWRSNFGGSAWEFDDKTGEYYLHVFSRKQPDLNWENPKVRKEVIDMVNWWMEKGIGGFRVDAITFIKKREDFSDIFPADSDGYAPVAAASLNQNGIHEFLRELNQGAFAKYDIMTVAEAPGVPLFELDKYVGPKGYFSMLFDFSYTDLDIAEDGVWCKVRNWTLHDFKSAITSSQITTERAGWGALYLENHDQPRSLNKYIKKEDICDKSAKMLAAVYFLLRGTPFIYQGQELGMTNAEFPSIEDYNDIASIDQYNRALAEGFSEKEALEVLWRRSRDNNRTPMQWDSSNNTGFSENTPWLIINPNYQRINVKNALENRDSIYYFYKRLIDLRKNSEYSDVLVYGKYQPVLEEHESIIAYLRVLDGKRVLVLANFKGIKTEIKLNITIKKHIISNDDKTPDCLDTLVLDPYDLFVYEV